MNTCFLGLGSNIGDREQNIVAAVDRIAALPSTRLKHVSSLYVTSPVGIVDQPDFLNAVIAVDTLLPPLVLLEKCLAIEGELKRVRTVKGGPRTIDIDILLYGSLKMDTPALTIPHPALHLRRFVLIPLCEIAPDVPCVDGLTAAELLARLPADTDTVLLYKRLFYPIFDKPEVTL